MENNNNNNSNTTGQSQSSTSGSPKFGITEDLKAQGISSFPRGGIYKSFLAAVISEQVGKDESKRFDVLTFIVKDVEGRTLRFSEFVPQEGQDFEKRHNELNVRIKHIWDAHAPSPQGGLGMGVNSFKEFFDKVAIQFNTGNNGKPIFKKIDGDKELHILQWTKIVYDTKGNLRLPYRPNFMERIEANNQTEAKTIVIDNKFDIIVQPDANSGKSKGTTIGSIGAKSDDDFAF